MPQGTLFSHYAANLSKLSCLEPRSHLYSRLDGIFKRHVLTDPPSIPITEQDRVTAWLRDTIRCPGYAIAYEAACRFVRQPPPGYITLLAHIGRDVMNGLARDYQGIVRAQVQYVQHLNRLTNAWKIEWNPHLTINQTPPPASYCIPAATCRMISDLIHDHIEGRTRSNETDALFFTTFFDYSNGDALPATMIQDWKRARNWFQKRAHFTLPGVSLDHSAEALQHFYTLHRFLHVAAQSDFQRLSRLDDYLAEANS